VEKFCRVGKFTDDSGHISIAFWITIATHMHSKHVTLIAISLHQWLVEGVSVLGYTFIVCPVVVMIVSHSAVHDCCQMKRD
jgi:hypothetical protein